MQQKEFKKRIVSSVLKFLNKEARESSPDKQESIEVAVQCLQLAYNIEAQTDEVDDLEALFRNPKAEPQTNGDEIGAVRFIFL